MDYQLMYEWHLLLTLQLALAQEQHRLADNQRNRGAKSIVCDSVDCRDDDELDDPIDHRVAQGHEREQRAVGQADQGVLQHVLPHRRRRVGLRQQQR